MKVLIVTYPHIGLNHGGLQLQIEQTTDAMRNSGIEVVPYNPWLNQLDEIDIVHIFSCDISCAPIVRAAIKNRKPIVVSPVFNSYYRNVKVLQAQVKIAHLIRGCFTTLKESSFILSSADCIVALTEAEKECIATVFNVDDDKIWVIPNGVNANFSQASECLFKEKFSIEDYVLCVGKIEKRKNQLSLIKACDALGKKLVLIGPANNFEQDYYDECRKNASENTLFIGELGHDDPLLSSAFAGASLFALPSLSEVLPLTVLEAIATDRKVLLTNNCALVADFSSVQGIEFTDPDVASIVRGLQRIDALPTVIVYSDELKTKYNWSNVAGQLIGIYADLVGK